MPDKFVGYRKIEFYSQKVKFLFDEGSLKHPQIVKWENNLCGLVCVLMVLNAFDRLKHTVSELLDLAGKDNAYDSRKGWIHAKIADLLRYYGIVGKSKSIKGLAEIYELLCKGCLVIASVSPNYSDFVLSFFPRRKTGHLILIIGMFLTSTGRYKLVIHDPGSAITESRQNFIVDGMTFNKNFSGRGIIFNKSDAIL